MNSPTKEEVKEKRQLCYRSVTALFAQVPEEVAHDVHANVTAYIDHLESELNSRPAEGQEIRLQAIKDYIKWNVEVLNVCNADPHYFKQTRDELLEAYLDSLPSAPLKEKI